MDKGKKGKAAKPGAKPQARKAPPPPPAPHPSVGGDDWHMRRRGFPHHHFYAPPAHSAPRERRAGGTWFALLIVLGAFVFTSACALTGPYVMKGYTVHIGAASPKKFKAPRQLVNEVATERLRRQAADAAPPMYRSDPDVSETAQERLDALYDALGAARAAMRSTTLADGTVVTPSVSPPDAPEGFSLSRAQMSGLMGLSVTEYVALRDSCSATLENVYAMGVKAETLDKSFNTAEIALDKAGLSPIGYRIACAVVRDLLVPNLVVDVDATEKVREEKAAEVEPLYIYAGQTIVNDGDIVTEEAFVLLESFGFVNNSAAARATTIGGLLLAVLLLFLPICGYVRLFRPQTISNRKEMLLLFTLFILAVGTSRAMVNAPFYFVPIALFAALAAALVNERLSIVCTVFLTLAAALVCAADIQFILFFLINGLSAAMLMRFVMNREHMLPVALLLSALSAASVAAIHFLFGGGYSDKMATDCVLAVLAGLLTVMITLGSMPVWESVFGVVTSYRLAFLTSPNSPVLRRLITEAPGTYQHSIMVANLAETAAFDVGANHTLTRVGAYYHDIGKTNYPHYFSENQMGENPHDNLSPAESVEVIVSHVANGLKMAQEYKLPAVLNDFIEQHHGTTLVKYFYYKAYDLSMGDMPDPEAFRYPHRKPQNRETAIVMLADTVEAAVRSMLPSVKSFDEVEETIANLIKDKLEDGQLADSGLVIKDLDTIAKSFVRVFHAVNHGRIAYPRGPQAPPPHMPPPHPPAVNEN